MSREYLVFEQSYLTIPLQDFPDVGDIIVCHANADRWIVIEYTGDRGSPKSLGLFWLKDVAVRFAKSETTARQSIVSACKSCGEPINRNVVCSKCQRLWES